MASSPQHSAAAPRSAQWEYRRTSGNNGTLTGAGCVTCRVLRLWHRYTFFINKHNIWRREGAFSFLHLYMGVKTLSLRLNLECLSTKPWIIGGLLAKILYKACQWRCNYCVNRCQNCWALVTWLTFPANWWWMVFSTKLLSLKINGGFAASAPWHTRTITPGKRTTQSKHNCYILIPIIIEQFFDALH